MDGIYESIPKTKKARSVPWWNKECKVAVFSKRKTYRKYRGYRSEYHYTQFKKLTNNSEEKKLYWATLILTIDYGSPTVNQVEIINVMTNNNQTLLNNGSDTRHDIHTNKFSAIDLTLTNPALNIK